MKIQPRLIHRLQTLHEINVLMERLLLDIRDELAYKVGA